MIIVSFIVYFAIFIVLLSGPELRKKDQLRLKKLVAVPALLAIVMVLLTIIKVYFIYKLLILIFVLVTTLLSYWQWGKKLRHWWK
ncbi:MAG TPA: hypothetical protein VIM51_01650 [Desulfosporosinus sp.]